MATISSASITRIHDVEGALTLTSIGGGAGAAANTDIFIQNAQSAGRRMSNVTLAGFLLDDGAGNDLSATDVHIGVWMWMTHFASLTALRLRVASNSGTANYDEHVIPLTQYPLTGGWIRVWIDISRTPDFTGGTALDEASVRHVGPVVSLPTVGGNAANLIMDAIDYTVNGLSATGTGGVWQDFLSFDEGTTTNKYGVVFSLNKIVYCLSRIVLGTSTSLVFNDSNFTIVFPDQSLVASNFMGINVDLQNASTNIDWIAGSFQSPGTVKGDLVVTGTSGTLDIINCSFKSSRIITLTSKCTITGTTFGTCGLLTQAGASISTCVFNLLSHSSGMLVDDPSKVSSCTFNSDGTGHAMELTATGTYTMTGNEFFGYGADETTNAAVYNNSGGAITLNIAGGVGSPTVRNGAGASTTVNNSKTLTFTGIETGSEVRLFNQADNSELTGIETQSGGITSIASIVSGGSGYTVNDIISIVGGTYTTQGKLKVTSVSSGVITGVIIDTVGVYTVNPANPVSVTGGTGSGATFRLNLSGTFQYPFNAGAIVARVFIFHLNFVEVNISNILLDIDRSIPIQARSDRNYVNL